MADILQTSLFVRLLQKLYALFCAVAEGSRFLRFFSCCWRSSRTRALISRCLGRKTGVLDHSGYTRFFSGVNSRLGQSARLRRWLDSSLLFRFGRAVLSCGKNSRILSGLFSEGMNSLLLAAAAFYVLIDYVLRDMLAIPLVSSLWDEALLLICLFWIVYQRLDRSPCLSARTNVLDLPVLFFITTALVLSVVVDPYPSIQFSGLRATVQYMLWFFIITRMLRGQKDLMTLYLCFVALAFGIALHGIYQYIVGVEMPSNWVAQAETAVRTRVYSIFGSPNIMGDYMAMFVPMTAALAYYFRDIRLKAAAWICAGVMCVACLFTMSRGAWAAIAVAIVLFILLVDRRLIWPLLLGCVCLLFVPFVRTRIGFLFTDAFLEANTNGGRGGRKIIALDLLSRRDPLLGVGLGMFGGAVAMQNQVLDWQEYFYVDNYYLKILVEMGWTGLAAFVAALLGWFTASCRALARTFRAWKQKQDRAYPLIAGMFSGLCGVLVHCSAENIFEEPYMMVYFWTLAAMIVWLGFLRGQNSD